MRNKSVTEKNKKEERNVMHEIFSRNDKETSSDVSHALDTLSDKNAEEINCIVSKGCLGIFVIIWVLLFVNSVLKLFSFNMEVKLIIAVFGTVATLTPTILYKCRAPEHFLKYYILIMLEIVIALLGTQNTIGIHITYVLVPVASCLYFDKKFTQRITIFSYIAMAIAVYFNAFGRFETVYLGWDQFNVFVMYLVGFSFEYAVLYLFLRVLIIRVMRMVTEQQNMLIQLQSEKERYRLILESTQDVVFEYNPEKDEYHATNSVYSDVKDEKQEVNIQGFMEYIYDLPLVDSTFRDIIRNVFTGGDFEKTEVNLSILQEDKTIPKWFLVEGSIIRNQEGKPIRFVGKLHDITTEKQYDLEKQAAMHRDPVTGLYLYQCLEKRLHTLPENEQKGVAISVLIENFKQLEESYGYVYCDTILKNVADVIRSYFGQNGYFCRMHGAHFLIFISKANFKDGFHYKQELQKALEELYVGEKEPSSLTANIYFKNIRIDEIIHMLSEVDGLSANAENTTTPPGRKTMYEVLDMGNIQLADEAYTKLAEGQKFLLKLMELLKHSKDIRSSLHVVMAQAGEQFMLDRIVIVESDLAEGVNRFNYQWNRNPEDVIKETYFSMTQEEKLEIINKYDENGYLEIVDNDNLLNTHDFGRSRVANEMIGAGFMGSQLWIPTLSDGEYTGAIFFDRRIKEPFEIIDKYLLSEFVNMLSAYVTKYNSDEANRAKSTFLSNMSHEIRTPMNAIIGMAEVALREDISESQRQYLETIRSAGSGLLTIINDILDFSKIESGKIEIVNDNYEILSLINDVNVIIQERNKEKKLDLKLEIPDTLPKTLYGDMVRIKQVIVNLASNAVKYTDKGSVTVKIDCDKPVDDMTVMRVSVTDTGMGIKKEDVSRLFQSFSQVDTTRNHHKEGTGLGLAISKQLIELMGGNIHVESVYGEGSTFAFELPQKVIVATAAGRLKDYKAVSEVSEEMTFIAPDAHVLVVDDNRMNLRVAMKLLEPLGMQMDSAESGVEAIDKVEKMDFDLVFMDHMMPVMDGIEATRRIRQLGSSYEKLPIIAFTANAMNGAEELFLGAGMNDFLSKPIDGKTICAKVRQWLPAEKIVEIDSDSQPDAKQEPENAAPIDDLNVAEGIKNSGTEKLFYSLLGDFYKLIDIKAKKMEKCLEDGMIRDFTIEVHALKNTARMIGALKLSKMAEELEQAGNREDHQFLKMHAAEALEKYRSYKLSLKEYGRRDDEGKPEISKDLLTESMNGIKDAMNVFDIDSVDSTMKELEKYRIPEAVGDLFEQLEAAVADVDIENVMQLADQISAMEL